MKQSRLALHSKSPRSIGAGDPQHMLGEDVERSRVPRGGLASLSFVVSTVLYRLSPPTKYSTLASFSLTMSATFASTHEFPDTDHTSIESPFLYT